MDAGLLLHLGMHCRSIRCQDLFPDLFDGTVLKHLFQSLLMPHGLLDCIAISKLIEELLSGIVGPCLPSHLSATAGGAGYS